MFRRGYEVAGVRHEGLISGYVLQTELGDRLCRDYERPFEAAVVLLPTAPLTEVIQALREAPRVFVRILGQVGGMITRADLQDPPVRMWLFGLVTAIELRFHDLIEAHLPEAAWAQYLSPERTEKARLLLAERSRREQHPTLLDCLQFADKGQIIARDETLRKRAGFPSRRRADYAVKLLEGLRNNLAHSQDIVASDWDTIAVIAANLERVIDLMYPD
ncbi:MAG: hypothetical protein MUC51_09070 [Anaerolineae bacterium]|nr:hypothetical protein [Anaerolineae bacterium]